jgi:hypothetical protein
LFNKGALTEPNIIDRDYLLSNMNRHREIFWKVTEEGYFLCAQNCLLHHNADKETNRNQKLEFKKRIHFPTLSKELENFKLAMANNLANLTHKTKNHNLSKTIKTSKNRSLRLECFPYENVTQYDMLHGVLLRNKQKGIPEPELIHIFDRTGNLKLSQLRQRLIKMKQNKVGVVLI